MSLAAWRHALAKPQAYQFPSLCSAMAPEHRTVLATAPLVGPIGRAGIGRAGRLRERSDIFEADKDRPRHLSGLHVA